MPSLQKLLWVEASPNGPTSMSTECARAFIDALVEEHGAIEVDHLDLWAEPLPVFGREATMAKIALLRRQEHSSDEQSAWSGVLAEIDRVRAHDALVISCPMWNLHIPYPLKQWIDIIVQPLVTFEFDKTGHPAGVLGAGRCAQLILTRSAAYDGINYRMTDFQRPYLECVFGEVLGYTLADAVVVEPTTAYTPEQHAALHERAVGLAGDAGRAFAAQLATAAGGR